MKIKFPLLTMNSFDLILLLTKIFGISQNYGGKLIDKILSRIFLALNLLIISILLYKSLTTGPINGKNYTNVINIWFHEIYVFSLIATSLGLQINNMIRRVEKNRIGRTLIRLNKSSSWHGDKLGFTSWLLFLIIAQVISEYRKRFDDDKMSFISIRVCSSLILDSQYITAEYFAQSMMLFENELKSLSSIAQEIAKKKYDQDIEEIRILNQRHISICTFFNDFDKITGSNHLLIIETKKLLLWLNVARSLNEATNPDYNFSDELMRSVYFFFDLGIMIRYFYRGDKLTLEAERFVNSLEQINSLAFENDEFFNEFQIFRKQAKIRKSHYDCNRFLKLDMKLVYLLFKDAISLIIVLLQMSHMFTDKIPEVSNATIPTNIE